MRDSRFMPIVFFFFQNNRGNMIFKTNGRYQILNGEKGVSKPLHVKKIRFLSIVSSGSVATISFDNTNLVLDMVYMQVLANSFFIQKWRFPKLGVLLQSSILVGHPPFIDGFLASSGSTGAAAPSCWSRRLGDHRNCNLMIWGYKIIIWLLMVIGLLGYKIIIWLLGSKILRYSKIF